MYLKFSIRTKKYKKFQIINTRCSNLFFLKMKNFFCGKIFLRSFFLHTFSSSNQSIIKEKFCCKTFVIFFLFFCYLLIAKFRRLACSRLACYNPKEVWCKPRIVFSQLLEFLHVIGQSTSLDPADLLYIHLLLF